MNVRIETCKPHQRRERLARAFGGLCIAGAILVVGAGRAQAEDKDKEKEKEKDAGKVTTNFEGAENVPGPLHAKFRELVGVSASVTVEIRVTVSF